MATPNENAFSAAFTEEALEFCDSLAEMDTEKGTARDPDHETLSSSSRGSHTSREETVPKIPPTTEKATQKTSMAERLKILIGTCRQASGPFNEQLVTQLQSIIDLEPEISYSFAKGFLAAHIASLCAWEKVQASPLYQVSELANQYSKILMAIEEIIETLKSLTEVIAAPKEVERPMARAEALTEAMALVELIPSPTEKPRRGWFEETVRDREPSEITDVELVKVLLADEEQKL